ncbi:hypothetical protein Pint_21820 [Pistacia integerrima]|uniref:Uncharacterized protein n=1 Tax=Pistacia integerrima TaxID=434235 RepID=A0ACC0XC60_9ROSI|nr:hypothetical protein Pint_21820 [Pistacia integerrima]
MIDAPPFKIDMPESGKEFNPDQKIVLAHVLFDTFKCLFADLNTSDVDRQSIESLLKGMTHDAFEVIAIELGFVYDLLYTKSIVIHTPWGLVRRVTTIVLTFVVLLIFPFVEKSKHLKLEVGITFFLLVTAVFLEIYAAVVLFFSDQSRNWFIGCKKINAILRLIRFLELRVSAPRWSNSMGQYSFTSLCIKDKSGFIIPRLLHAVKQLEKLPFLGKLIIKMHRYIDKLLEQLRYKTSSEDVTGDLKTLIFKHVKSEHDQFEKDTGAKRNLRELQERAFKDFQKEHDRVKENGGNYTNLKELFELTFNRLTLPELTKRGSRETVIAHTSGVDEERLT